MVQRLRDAIATERPVPSRHALKPFYSGENQGSTTAFRIDIQLRGREQIPGPSYSDYYVFSPKDDFSGFKKKCLLSIIQSSASSAFVAILQAVNGLVVQNKTLDDFKSSASKLMDILDSEFDILDKTKS